MKAASINPHDVFTLTPRYIRRDEIEEADSGGTRVRINLSKSDQARFNGVRLIDIRQTDDDAPIEKYQQYSLTITSVVSENWYKVPVTGLKADARPIPFIPKNYVRVDGINAADCRSLERKFGPDFPTLIAGAPDILSAFRFSKEKKAVIRSACRDEVKAAKKSVSTAKIVNLLCACDVSKAKARWLAQEFDESKSLHQFLYKGQLSFLQSIHFAHLVDPARAVEDRVTALWSINSMTQEAQSFPTRNPP